MYYVIVAIVFFIAGCVFWKHRADVKAKIKAKL